MNVGGEKSEKRAVGRLPLKRGVRFEDSVPNRAEGQQRKKRIAYQRSELGDALVGIVIHVVSMISTEAAFPTIGF